ncbi:hypothetical protein DL93DRAFT_2089881 [Clavulina sp. PMI_390]|nr:hypothetical protein DL93DRAFT_2089881 [Clavulina sp. PMI_390]
MYLEFILHGSGTSSSVPNVSCLTSNRAPRCPTCWSTKLPSGKKNFRRNTGALIRLRRDEGEGGEWDDESVIMIDAGKTFLAAAQELFPLHGMRKIAALVLTHAHADAMNGLDDLRGWTLHGRIQDHIDIYLARETFQEVKRSFPYLVAKEFATGGGDVSAPFSLLRH